MAGEINFFTEGVSFQLKHKRKIRLWITEVILKTRRVPGTINYIFCSDAYLLKINKDYLRHDYFTDIITFSHGTGKLLIEGDIFISIDRVRENAAAFKVTFFDELNRVMVHGILHLSGYKDKQRRDVLLMRKMENKMLSLRTF